MSFKRKFDIGEYVRIVNKERINFGDVGEIKQYNKQEKAYVVEFQIPGPTKLFSASEIERVLKQKEELTGNQSVITHWFPMDNF